MNSSFFRFNSLDLALVLPNNTAHLPILFCSLPAFLLSMAGAYIQHCCSVNRSSVHQRATQTFTLFLTTKWQFSFINYSLTEVYFRCTTYSKWSNVAFSVKLIQKTKNVKQDWLDRCFLKSDEHCFFKKPKVMSDFFRLG